jgi:hypothetical protein
LLRVLRTLATTRFDRDRSTPTGYRPTALPPYRLAPEAS